MFNPMIGIVAMAVKELTNKELAALNLVAQSDGDPRGCLFDYETVKFLFAEGDGTRMHSETKNALAAIVLQRLT